MSAADRDPELSTLYQATRRECPDSQIDRDILEAAHRTARRHRVSRRFGPALATAAVLVMGVTITLRVLDQRPPTSPLATARAPAAKPDALGEQEVSRRLAYQPAPPIASPEGATPSVFSKGPVSGTTKSSARLPRMDAAPAEETDHPTIAGLRQILTRKRFAISRLTVGRWRAETPLTQEHLARAFPEGITVWQTDGMTPGVDIQFKQVKALRLYGERGQPVRRIELYPNAKRWLPSLPFDLSADELGLADCLLTPEQQKCPDPQQSYLSYRLENGQIIAVIWLNSAIAQ